MATLGERIQARREQCGLSVADLASAAGIARGYLYQIERDESDPTVSVAVRIADALGVTVNALAYDDNMPDDALAMRARIAKALDALADG